MGFTSDTIPPEVVAGLPPWLQAQVPQYDKTKVPLIIATLTVCMTIACLAMGLRLYSRYIARQAYGLDDLFAGLALVRDYPWKAAGPRKMILLSKLTSCVLRLSPAVASAWQPT
jgi:hypothetical protein